MANDTLGGLPQITNAPTAPAQSQSRPGLSGNFDWSNIGDIALAAGAAATGNWPAAIAAGAKVAGSLISAKGQKDTNDLAIEEARIQRDWQEKMMDKQNAWNLNMWNMQNEYNTPSAVMKRYLDAGINPIFANGQNINTPAAQLTSAGVGPSGLPTLGNAGAFLGNGVSELGLLAAQIDNIKADTAQKYASAGVSEAEQSQIKLNTYLENITGLWQRKAELDKTQNDAALSKQQKENAEKNSKLIDNQIEEVLTQIGLNNEQKEVFKATAAKLDAEAEQVPAIAKAQIAAYYASAAKDKKSTEEIQAEIDSMDWQNAKIMTYKEYLSLNSGHSHSSSVHGGLSGARGRSGTQTAKNDGFGANGGWSGADSFDTGTTLTAETPVVVVRNHKTGELSCYVIPINEEEFKNSHGAGFQSLGELGTILTRYPEAIKNPSGGSR